MLPFTRTELERLFPSMTWQRAEQLFDTSAVVEVDVERDGRSITGRVRGERRVPFLTRINVANGRGGRVRLSSTCTCLIHSECEHAAATLLAALQQTASPDAEEAHVAIDGELEAWIAQVNQAARTAPGNGGGDGEDCVLYLIEPTQRLWRDTASVQPVAVSTVRARRLRGGAYGREHPLAISNLTGEDPPPYVGMDDQLIGRLLGGGAVQSKRLGTPGDGETLERMLGTGRCHWRNGQNHPLTRGEPRPGRFGWRFDGDGQQRLTCELADAGEELVVVGLGEPWYIDLKAQTCGRIETAVPQRVARLLLKLRPSRPRSRPWSARSSSLPRPPARCPSPCASASGWRCGRPRSSTSTARR